MNLVSLLLLPAVINLEDNDGARYTIAGVASSRSDAAVQMSITGP